MIKNSARMRLLYWTFLGLSFIAPVSSSAQMQTSNGIQYGNEWIEYDRDYLKISVGQDGLYRIDGKTLQESGLPANVRGDQLKLIWLGNEQPISLTSDDIFTETDYLEFYGQRNRSQVDRYLWSDPDQQMLNPSYSLYSDTSAYYLTWSSENRNLRYQEGGALMDNSEPRTTYRHQQEVFLRNRLNKPTLNSQGVRFSTYQSGEGYGSTLTTRHSVKIPADHIAEGERPAVLRYRISGNSQSHVVDVEWNTTPLGNLTFFGSALIDSSYTIASSDLAEANTIKFTSSGGSDRIVVSSFDLTYDRELVYSTETLVYPFLGAAAGFRFSLKTEPGEQGKIVAYDVSDRHKLLVEPSVDGVMVHVPPGSDVRDILITDISNALTPGLIKRMAFEDLTTTQGDYIIISSSKLAGSELDAYAQYRSSPAGGGYDATLATIEQLTDQFAYGVPMHPLGIKNFVNYVAAAWTEPKFVFIIGRGYHYNIVRTASRTNHLVPSFGIPGSDNVMASAGNSSIPQVPIGRLAASSVQDITNYLDKVVVMEDQMANAPQTVQDRAWMKRILHLSAGGVGGSERLILENSLKSMGQILERNKFGADITSFSKNSQDLVTEEINEDLTRLVEDGIILKTYFGHGGINITELDNFEQPENFNNLNRYSCMVSLGCHTGDMYTDVVSLSEDNVLAVDRGAIAYIATSGLGFLSSLDQFGDTWYDLLGGEFYGAALGASLKGAIERMSSSSSIGITTLLQQLTLHGDPAYRLSPEGQGSDFTFDIATARTEPSTVSSTAKSFDFIVDLVNLGQSVEDSVSIRFQRVLADGSIGEEKEIVTQVNGFSSTLQVTFDNSIPGISGKNTIRAVVNNDRLIPEAPDPQAYNNNALSSQTEGFAFFIRDNSILPTSPCEFSILNDPGDLVLRASTSDPFAKSNTYHFELDTTRRFNSPLQMRETITSKGGVIEWSPTFALTEGQVYYWRVSPDSTSEQPYLWEESSFTYRPQSNTGWSQSHHGQFELDDLIGLVPKSNGRMQFDSTGFFMTITNGVWSSEVGAQFNFETNAVSIRPWLVTNEGVAIVVIDPTTGILWENVSGQFGSISTGSINSKRAFVFPTSTTEERDLVIDMLTNEIPTGHLVYFFTLQRRMDSDFQPEDWAADGEPNIFTTLEEQGALQIRDLATRGSVPYGFAYRKGFRPLAEVIAMDSSELVVLNAFNALPLSQGSIKAGLIGPVKSWESLTWELGYSEPDDSNYITVEALRPDLSVLETITLEQEQTYPLDIDAAEAPFLNITYTSADSDQRTSSTLADWTVLYQELPDVAVTSASAQAAIADTVQKGESISIPFGYLSLNDVDTDSLTIRYTLVDERNNVIESIEVVPPLNGFERRESIYSIETDQLLGNYRLSIEINPDGTPREKSLLDNIGVHEFRVEGERIAPVLDVFFDGIRIKNGDLVSSRPSIDIDLKDENAAQLIDSPDLFEIRLIHPDGNAEIIDASTDDRATFTAATSPSESARVSILAELFTDGIYTLRVQGRDKLNNESGRLEFSVEFEIETASSVSRIFNYPNPFSTSTQFIFTLTGGELPTYFAIQIMAPNGTVVKTITQAELGPLRIGLNKTSYAWDGTDDFGDKLANGIYLYRVKIYDDAQSPYENRYDQNQERFFERDLGKLVILR